MSKTVQVHRKYATIKHRRRLYHLYCDDIKKVYKAKPKKTPTLPKYYETKHCFT